MQRRKHKVIFGAVLLLYAISVPVSQGHAQTRRRSGKFSQAQKIGYLGQTSRSAMARNILSRLKNQRETRAVADQTDRVLMWHEIVLDTIAIDHTPDPDSGAVGFSQGGPTRTSRALAMVQIAVFDAANSIIDKYHT